jgi:hypothetical protein
MRRSHRMLFLFVGLVVLASAIALSVTLMGGNGATVSPETALAAAPATAPTPSAPAANDPTAALPQVTLSADFAVGYSSIGQLKRSADLVVRGEVVDVSYLDFNTCAYTKVTFKVAKCFKGDAEVGDQITILEVGGVTTMASVKGDKFGTPTKEDAETKVKVLLDGAPLTQVGEDCLYFLGKGEINVVPGTYYVPMGAFQGRFKIDNGTAKRFIPSDMQGGKLTSLAMDEPTVDDTVTQAAAQ